ncbi:GntR family transcriptional regulator [Leifsonia xyli subsp. cynodontis DSM 46306]|uniref:Uncharacterized protein n=1 Tax=Leifsonia xyli subsp. cynodontis DSM 46306 TaxID=1389489 RepID=U3PAZ7_LEIXC|nr:hypothetical protein [Leifsonia xyli]AGW42729.1 GntR family transcriptional regulator [Leifsonia xyli subsp. cynodontis DSM 46306]
MVLTRLYEETVWGLVFRVRAGYETADLRESVNRLYQDLRDEVTITTKRSTRYDQHHPITPRRPVAAAH